LEWEGEAKAAVDSRQRTLQAQMNREKKLKERPGPLLRIWNRNLRGCMGVEEEKNRRGGLGMKNSIKGKEPVAHSGGQCNLAS